MKRFSAFRLLLAAFLAATPLRAAEFAFVPFADLNGWDQDAQQEALDVFTTSCTSIRSTDDIPASDWGGVCALAQVHVGSAKGFFETHFRPVRITDGERSLFTGYFEPELPGSRQRTDVFKYPLYAVPPELPRGEIWKSRAEIQTGILAGRGLELVWLDNPVDAFFVHIQGSSRFNMRDGSVLRLGFAGRNGHKYKSVGRQMIELGLLQSGQASAGRIRDWVHANPERGRLVLQLNPSFIFFQELDLPEDLGPRGALQYPLTPMRSIAVDPDFTPLGAPAWVDMPAGAATVNRLMIAQDTGSAINGAQRADIFYGSGLQAGTDAGAIRYAGELVTLVPRSTALRLTGRVQ